MVSSSHEAMHRIFRDHPEIIDQTLRTLGFDFPDTVATTLLPTDATEIRPIERRPDTVLKLEVKDGREFVFVFEAQREPSKLKLRSWPYYMAYLHEAHEGLPVILVVVCHDVATAEWASKPITMGVGFWTSMIVNPFVLGPHNVPVPEGPIDESGIPLAVLAAITHALDPDIDGILAVLAAALKDTDETTRFDFSLFTQLGLGKFPAAQTWRNLMAFDLELLRTSPVISEILDEHDGQVLAKGRAEGRTEEKAADILRILDLREVRLTGPERDRIATCTDLETLDRWFDAAVTATGPEDLFG